MEPLLSVVIPTHDRAAVLPRAVASVLAQPGKDWELIVVDDASTDGTRAWLESLDDERIRTVFLERNGGVNVARNRGVEAARGRWIVPLDSDDELMPDALDSIRRTIHKTDVPWLLGRCVTFDGKSLARTSVMGHVGYRDYLHGKVAGEYLAVVKRAVLQRHPFPETISGGEHVTWLQLAKHGYGPYVANAVWRRYDDTGTDRLTVKRKNYARLAKVFRHDLQVHGTEYLKRHPKRFVGTLLRAVYYSLASFVR